MLQPRDYPTKFRGRVQLMFVRACAVTLLICLVLYTVTLTDVHVKTAHTIESWNLSMFVQNTLYKLQNTTKLPSVSRKRKLILLWTNYFSKSDWLPSTIDLRCPVAECDTTSDRSLLRNSSAVILHWRNIDTGSLPECSPSENNQCPIWVLFNKEAPPHTPRDILEAVNNKVHWTATYRTDSDIHAPYGKVFLKQLRSSAKSDFDPKRRLLCWLVSNCNTPSKREVFVTELLEYLGVDVYGACGNLKCPHTLVNDCYQWMSKRCMFYLSLENSNCRDYTTEKLYNAMASDMVPVVMGNSSNYKHLPPRSFINAQDFSSPKELSEYLVSVGKDKNLYLSYFWWKKDYEVKDQSYMWFCDLCDKLHNTKVENIKPHRNLVSWWFDQSGCTSWRNL